MVAQACPQCGRTLFDITEEGIVLQDCEHYRWRTDLDSITNDEIRLRGGMKLRLLRR